jgi:hypothetical protein
MGCASPSLKTRPILGQEHEIENSNRLPSQGGGARPAIAPPSALAHLPEPIATCQMGGFLQD